MSHPIYLDYNATTPVHPEVLDAMMPFFNNTFGNPSSNHPYGTEAKIAIENARDQVAALLGCKSHEILFTSGGSESNNLAIKGIASQYRDKGNHIITSAIEHPAVTEVCKYLETSGFNITWLPVDHNGKVSLDDLEGAITTGTILVSIMHANNEVGTIQPVKAIAEIAHRHGVLVHTDAAQSAGKISVYQLGADLVSLAGHKLYAPKGIGVLYIREGVKLEKLIHGADHEQNLRAGTENVPYIVGLGKACEIAHRELDTVSDHSRKMRDLLYNTMIKMIPEVVQNGHPDDRLPNTLSLSFPSVDANLVLSEISGQVAASAGAACHAGGTDISATLTAMHVPFEMARGTIRFSTGRYTTEDEMSVAAEIVAGAYSRLTTSRRPTVDSRQSTVSGQRSAPLPLSPDPLFPLSKLERGREGEVKEGGEVGIKLTQFTAGLGCACKLRPQELEKILKKMPVPSHPDILVGIENSDDAAVYRINEKQAIVQTVDFFTPIVDDPYNFGAIAAANSLSDIYAMGAKPLFALNIVAFPSNRLPMEVLEQILAGAVDKAKEAGVQVIGGHTIDDPEPKYGMAVTGIVHPDGILRNKGAKPGDVLVLTKPIGTGILATALKRGLLEAGTTVAGSRLPLTVETPDSGHMSTRAHEHFVSSMLELNKAAAEVMQEFEVHACTDVTGFGLLGHLDEMTSASGVDAEIDHAAVPVLPGTFEMTSAGAIPGGTMNNKDYTGRYVKYSERVPELMRIILNDAQTSGGLLISLAEKQSEAFLNRLESSGLKGYLIGKVLGEGPGMIHVY